MAEEMTTPVQGGPGEADAVPAAPAAAGPAAAPASAAPRQANQDRPLRPILTVFLIVVGIADVILWGIVGYYLLQNLQSGGNSAWTISAAGEAAGEGGSSSDAEGQDALEVYIQEMQGIWERLNEEAEYRNKVVKVKGREERCA